ncbi:MAG: response regulator transcription factor [Lachnospiraceae bacterium]|nr:response regulator transcription factor [Lachnospiraceae bacterium]
MNRILLVEDDALIVESLTSFLKTEGFEVKAVPGQKEALDCLDSERFDLALLDITLQNGNGFSLCGAMRQEYDVPVIFLTASGEEYSVVAGLDMGAEDYIRKPFRPRELVSRIRTVLRRTGKHHRLIRFYSLCVDMEKAQVTKNGQEIFLSALEYRLLLIFCQNQGIVLTREKLLEELWDIAGEYVNDNTLTVYIKRLREKIEDDPAKPEMIKTVRGMGYRA